MRVLVSGTNGLIGSALLAALRTDGDEVTRLVRGPAGPGDVAWDPAAGTVDETALAAAGVDAVVHLAGEGIATRRWTKAQKQRIRDSRLRGTAGLCEALARLDRPPSVMVSGSAIGWYGDRANEVLTEDSGPGQGFLAQVCQDWETATTPAADAGIRVACVRTGIVLSATGGALKKQLPIFRLGLGGPLGRGRQYTSWIHIDDEVGAILHALRTPELTGPFNATAPTPVTAAEFARTLGRVLRRPAILPVPRPALAVVLGWELSGELLASQRLAPTRLQAGGYRFSYPDLEPALRQLLCP